MTWLLFLFFDYQDNLLTLQVWFQHISLVNSDVTLNIEGSKYTVIYLLPCAQYIFILNKHVVATLIDAA